MKQKKLVSCFWLILCTLMLNASASASTHTPMGTWNLSSLDQMSQNSPQQRNAAWDTLLFAATLQGNVNRHAPLLYLYLNGSNGAIDRFWMQRMRAESWPRGAHYAKITGPLQALQLYKSFVRGAVVWDPGVPATADAAVTAAGVYHAVAVRYDTSPGSLYTRLIVSPGGPHLPVLLRLLHRNGKPLFTGKGVIPGMHAPSSGSAKCDVYLWAVKKFLASGLCSPRLLAWYPDGWWLTKDLHLPVTRTLLSNRDYCVAHKGFCFDLSPWSDEAPNDDPHQPLGDDYRTLRTMLLAAYNRAHGSIITVDGFPPWDEKYTRYTGGRHGGVATEWRYAEILSCYNACMDADAPGLDSMANASFFQHYPLRHSYPQHSLPTLQQLRKAGWLLPNGSVAPHHYYAIYMGDYDSSAWFYQMIPQFWPDPARGTLPIGWAFNPNIADRFPMGMDYVRKTADSQDFFLTGDSGAGYLNPGFLTPPRTWSGLPSGLKAWQRRCMRYYHQWRLGITGFVIDGNAPPMSLAVRRAYARFSPNGVVAQKIPYLSETDGTPFLRMSADLPPNPAQAAAIIAADHANQPASFAIYRAILWPPSRLAQTVQQVKTLQQNCVYVDPYTLFLLIRQQQKQAKPAHPLRF